MDLDNAYRQQGEEGGRALHRRKYGAFMLHEGGRPVVYHVDGRSFITPAQTRAFLMQAAATRA